MCDEIRISGQPDRGAFDTLTFNRCARGFTLHATSDYGKRHTWFAFDKIEDMAAWLVEQYGPPEITLVAKPAPPKRNSRRRR